MTDTDDKPKLVSVIIPLYNEQVVFSQLEAHLIQLQEQLSNRFEVQLILVDDGSSDKTWDLISSFAGKKSYVKGISLSRNFGHQRALFCGYSFAEGDAVVSMDGDLQDPPELIEEMLREWQAGVDIVFAVRRSRHGETRFKRWTAFLFYRLLNRLAEVSAPLDCGDFRLMSRRALDALLKMGDKIKYLRGMVGWVGFRTSQIEYARLQRQAGHTKFSIVKMVRFALEGITSFSNAPLRLSYLLSFFATIPFLIYLVFVLTLHFFGFASLVPGWTSLLLCIVAFGSLNLFAIGILGEYVAKVFETVKQRPDFIVREIAQTRK
jgi:glycosyltransferase involved in cell wall biosynthesis